MITLMLGAVLFSTFMRLTNPRREIRARAGLVRFAEVLNKAVPNIRVIMPVILAKSPHDSKLL